MAATVREYLDYFRQKEYPALLSHEDMNRLQNVERVFGDLESEETILEVRLSTEETGCDYSIRVDVDSPDVKEYWYELDSDACSRNEIAACYFIDASRVIPGKDNSSFYDNILVRLTDRERVDKLRRMLCLCVELLQGKCEKLFQLGSMTGRQETDRIRLFTEDLSREDLVTYLRELGWRGDIEALDSFLAYWENYSDRKKFILDFDVFEDDISEKIGINFGTVRKNPHVVGKFLNALQDADLCIEAKKEDVLRFIRVFPCHTPFMQNDISHFKILFQGSGPLLAKAYLRQGSFSHYGGFKAYDTPILMNLELTTRCPLRCPQCYCDLSGGKDMERDTALYWLKEAAKNKVRAVNLSGGETMLYPHLPELIRTCHELGMKANIALSGYGVSREALEELIDCGVYQICISLNGSTKQINSYSRDGYALALNALKLLAEIGYDRTCINWVMHSNNAEDMQEMFRLAEKYHVADFAVMVFKPDASYQRPSIPSGEQILRAAKQIKGYRGPLHIHVEECFSQLRAVMGQRFFFSI